MGRHYDKTTAVFILCCLLHSVWPAPLVVKQKVETSRKTPEETCTELKRNKFEWLNKMNALFLTIWINGNCLYCVLSVQPVPTSQSRMWTTAPLFKCLKVKKKIALSLFSINQSLFWLTDVKSTVVVRWNWKKSLWLEYTTHTLSSFLYHSCDRGDRWLNAAILNFALLNGDFVSVWLLNQANQFKRES